MHVLSPCDGLIENPLGVMRIEFLHYDKIEHNLGGIISKSKNGHHIWNIARSLLHFYLLCNFGGDVFLDRVIEDGFDSKGVHPVNSWFDGLSVFASHKLPVKGFLHDLPEDLFAKDGFSQLHELKLKNKFNQSINNNYLS